MLGKEALLRVGALPISIVPSATAFEVFDMLEGGRELVVVDNKGSCQNANDLITCHV